MAAPVPQFMDMATGLKFVEENAILKQQVQQLQSVAAENKQLQLRVASMVKRATEREEEDGCCDKCTNKCNLCAHRCDLLCTERCVKPYKDGFWNCGDWCSCIAAWTICSPCYAGRFIVCGTSYACCNANCSKTCLDL